MAEIRIDHLTESVTIPVMAVDADGNIWDGVDSFDAVGDYATTGALESAVNAMAFSSVAVNETHVGYALTLPAGVAAVACTLYCYDGTFSVGDEARWVYEHDPSIAALIGADGDTLETLSDQIDGISGGTGTGARSVTVTVNDGTDVLENATVRFTEGGNTYAGSTNASGVLAFSLDDATYAVTISKPGYSFTPTTLVVDGDETQTYSMAAVTIASPPNATTTTGVMTVYDEEGSVESGASVSVQILDGPGTDGHGYDSTVWTETSSALGVVSFAGIILGARYKIWRGDSKPLAKTFTAPTTGDSFNLAEVIGRG